MRVTRTSLVRIIKSRIALVLPLLATITVVTVAATTPSPDAQIAREQRQAAEEWVKAHAAALPKELHQVAALPVVTRLALQNELTWSERGHLWEENLGIFLLPDSALLPWQRAMVVDLGTPLTEVQRAFIGRVREQVHQVFAPDLSIEERQAIAQPLCDSVKAYFTRRQAGVIFSRLGGPSEVGVTTTQRAALGAELIIGAVRNGLVKLDLKKEPMTYCYCHAGSSCAILCDYGCSTELPCQVPPGSDSHKCGCFLIWICDGRCLQLTR